MPGCGWICMRQRLLVAQSPAAERTAGTRPLDATPPKRPPAIGTMVLSTPAMY